jgi:hypothetical protein
MAQQPFVRYEAIGFTFRSDDGDYYWEHEKYKLIVRNTPIRHGNLEFRLTNKKGKILARGQSMDDLWETTFSYIRKQKIKDFMEAPDF